MFNKRLCLLLLSSLLFLGCAAEAETSKQELDRITELNRLIWSWRRCVNRWEGEHGPSKDGKPPAICGPEPKLPTN